MAIEKHEMLKRVCDICQNIKALTESHPDLPALLDESERVWQSLSERIDLAAPLSNLPNMTVTMFDREGRVLYINPSGAEARGKDTSFYINKKMTELFPGEIAAKRMQKVGEVFASGKASQFIDRHERFVLDVFLYPIFGEGNEVARVVAFARDISEQERIEKALRESEERYRDIVERANSIILRWKPEGEITYANDFALKFFGYGRGELIGSNLFSTLLPEKSSTGEDHRRMAEDIARNPEKYKNHHNENLTRDGHRVWISWTNRAVLDLEGRVEEIISVGNDITERLAFEERLHRLNEELRNRQEKLEAANRELHAFTYTAAHDLRSPLTSIDGFSSLLMDTEDLTESGKDSLKRIRRSAERMNRLIGSLLDFSKAEHHQLKLTDVNLSKIAEEIVAEYAGVQPAKKTAFIIQPEVVVHADYLLIQQVLNNLFSNAVKYSGKAEQPEVKFSAVQTGKEIVCCVTDNGVGFDQKDVDKIFHPFHRLHPKSEFEGTGIGLATVQRIVQRHGGHVRAEAQPGGGATFSFSLPLQSETRHDKATLALRAGDTAG